MTRIVHSLLAAVLLLGCASIVAEPDRSRPKHVSGFLGEVLIDTKGSTVLVLIDTNKGGKDGRVDQWFTLEAEGPVAAISEHVTAAEIAQSDNFVRVIVPDRRVAYDFVIGGTGPVPDPPAGFTAIRVEGYGLSHTTGPTTIEIPRIRRDSVTAFDCPGCGIVYPCDGCDPGDGGGGAATCTAGGTGSTACSITSGNLSCSANCGQGYYACCNYTAYAVSCKCYRS